MKGKSLLAQQDVHIFDRGAQLWTTSVDVAEKFRRKHFHVLEAIREMECPDDFRASNFRCTYYMDDQGKEQPMYELTRDGFTLLAMSFSGKRATEWKIKYIAAFNAVERKLLELAKEDYRQARQAERRAQLEWQQARTEGKIERRELTDAVKELIQYARAQGSISPDRVFYMAYTKMVNHVLFEMTRSSQGFSDSLDSRQLAVLAVAEGVVSDAIHEAIVSGAPYKGRDGIFEAVKSRVARLAETVGPRPLLGRRERLALAG